MKMSRDLAVFRRRIVVVSAALVALCTAACMTLLAVPLINADMTMRGHMLEEFSNQPFDVERTGAGIEAHGTSGLIVAGADISWCRVAVDESDKMLAVECGGAAAVDRLSESGATQLVRLRDEVGSQPFSFDGRRWIGLWQPLGAQDGAVTVSNGNVAAVEAAPTGRRVYTFLDVTPHGEYVASLILRCISSGAVIVLCATAVAAFATTRSLRPVREARERERKFVLSASHELKTPLMAITSASRCSKRRRRFLLTCPAICQSAMHRSVWIALLAGSELFVRHRMRWLGASLICSEAWTEAFDDTARRGAILISIEDKNTVPVG